MTRFTRRTVVPIFASQLSRRRRFPTSSSDAARARPLVPSYPQSSAVFSSTLLRVYTIYRYTLRSTHWSILYTFDEIWRWRSGGVSLESREWIAHAAAFLATAWGWERRKKKKKSFYTKRANPSARLYRRRRWWNFSRLHKVHRYMFGNDVGNYISGVLLRITIIAIPPCVARGLADAQKNRFATH